MCLISFVAAGTASYTYLMGFSYNILVLMYIFTSPPKTRTCRGLRNGGINFYKGIYKG